MTTVAILLAGGSGARLQQGRNKVFADVGGRPLLAWSVSTFVDSPAVDRVVLVVRAGEHRQVADVLTAARPEAEVPLVTGGDTRQASEQAGLGVVADLGRAEPVDVVLIHDTARPFATMALIERVVTAARDVGGAVPAVPLGRDVYRATAGRLVAQPDDLVRVQTPQGFRARALLHAYGRAAREVFAGVDTVETVQRYTELAIAAVQGEADNIKVTYAADLILAQQIAARRGV
jgi:2-C-methyl-D-erythritol 4-phosphate cytidylyltransferase